MGRHTIGEPTPQGDEWDTPDVEALFWDTAADFADDRKLRPETVARLKRAGASLASGLAVAVALASWPIVKDALIGGHVDPPTLFESVRVAAVGAATTYLTSRLRRK